MRTEQYGTWRDWHREIAHVDLVAPRLRPLDGVLSTWSPGTNGTIEAGLVINPDVASPAEFEAWLNLDKIGPGGVHDGVAFARIDTPGSVFGEMSAVLERPASATVRAARETGERRLD